MTVPPADLQPDVNYFLTLESDARGISPADFTSLDLQIIAYGLRIATSEVSPDLAARYVEVADALDRLSDLDDSDQKYLASLYDLSHTPRS